MNTDPNNRLRLMHQAAEMYYLADKTQQEIAAQLGVSRPLVSRLLAEARQAGIVQITVVNPFADLGLLVEALKERLGLVSVVVAPGEGGSPAQVRKRLGIAAAQFLLSALQPADRLGIGWGRTLYEVSLALEEHPEYDLTVVPLMGGLGQIAPSFQVHALARTFAEKLGGLWHPLYIPAIIEDPVTRETLLGSRDVTRIVEMWDQLDAVVVGIGNLDLGQEIHMLFADYMDEASLALLSDQQAAGDICMHFFDVEGRLLNKGLKGVSSIALERLRQAPRRIGVAGGAEKAEAICGAVRGGYINILVTDEAAARRILELTNPAGM